MQEVLKLESIRIPRSGVKLSFDMIRNFRAVADDQNPANELVGVVYLQTKNVEDSKALIDLLDNHALFERDRHVLCCFSVDNIGKVREMRER